jgi:GT2 family glycosyltransferase
MKLTVFIPTYNGKDKVHRLLSRMRLQGDQDFSLHVLIDGSSDNTIALQSEFPEYMFHSFPNAGRAGIRNRALEIAQEGAILFLDHDMLPESPLIAQHRDFHRRNRGAILVGNGFRNPNDAKTRFGEYLVQTEQKWINKHRPELTISESEFIFSACNLSMPIEVFSRLNGFNAELKDGEDFEFGMRALKSGVRIQYNRSVRAWHDDWPTLDQYIRRNSEYLAGKKVLVRMNPEFENLLKVNAGERSHNRFKQFFQALLGRAAIKNSVLFRMLPLSLQYLAYKSAIYQFSKA